MKIECRARGDANSKYTLLISGAPVTWTSAASQCGIAAAPAGVRPVRASCAPRPLARRARFSSQGVKSDSSNVGTASTAIRFPVSAVTTRNPRFMSPWRNAVQGTGTSWNNPLAREGPFGRVGLAYLSHASTTAAGLTRRIWLTRSIQASIAARILRERTILRDRGTRGHHGTRAPWGARDLPGPAGGEFDVSGLFWPAARVSRVLP
jgi:hypothetical protein